MFLVENGFPVGIGLVNAAAEGGSLVCLQFIHTELHFDCWVPSTMAAAAGASQLQLVKQLHEQGCPWDESALVAAKLHRRSDCLEYLIIRYSKQSDVR